MTTIRIDELRAYRFPVAEVVVRGVDPMIYLLYARQLPDGPLCRVVDGKGQSLTSRSVEEARRQIAGLNVRDAWLEHQSTYDEMVGTDTAMQEQQLRVAISIPAEDL